MKSEQSKEQQLSMALLAADTPPTALDEQELCMALLRADTEAEVISLLSRHGYWNNPDVWRPFGDREDNFSTIGNQSSSAEAALVEKLVNSVDAVLMGECWRKGVRPNSPKSPRTISQAVADFFFKDRSKADTLGRISHWDTQKRRELSNLITLSATGSPQNPSFTVVDAGEGQTPESMPETLLSIDKQNKVDVHFVQGKFNMGGTGSLRFCGRNNLQLVISRRNPSIASMHSNDDSSEQWGFTIVRRENPTATKKISTYTYLAPRDIDKFPGRGAVLRFAADTLPLFPQRDAAYVRNAQWGTAIKLYEYQASGFRSHILRRDGLLYRLDLLLPQVALPIRLHECRRYKGHPGSFDTTLTGLGVRLSDDSGQNLEQGFPTSSTLSILGQQLTAEIYAFNRGRADTYRKDEGVIFSVNGQTHGNLTRRFFSRKRVGMNRLEDSILVVVDCSHIDGRSREDLFMNSRDRMERGDFLRGIEGELESLIKDNSLLRELRERRRREDVASRLEESKALKDVLESIIRKSPSLASLFAGRGPLPNPFNPKPNPETPFLGQRHPLFFKFKNLDYGQELHRETPINMRSRIVFETDVVSDYFKRERFPGTFRLRPLHRNGPLPDHRLNLENGVATLNLSLPRDVSVGDTIRYEATVNDETLLQPLVNRFRVQVRTEQERNGPPKPRPKPMSRDGLAIPEPILVYQENWGTYGFDKHSALKVVHDPGNDAGLRDSYTYYINMDNLYLQTELKATSEIPEIVKARWQYSLMVVGMALLQEEREGMTVDDENVSIEDLVSKTTATLAPVLLPLIESLGALSEEDLTSSS